MKKPALWQSFGHALEGIAWMLRHERSAHIHVVCGTLVVLLGLWLQLDPLRWSFVVLSIGAILAAEAMNTAVEAIVDLASPAYHELAKIAKDVAAGAVLLLGISVIIVGLLVLGPPLWNKVFPPEVSFKKLNSTNLPGGSALTIRQNLTLFDVLS